MRRGNRGVSIPYLTLGYGMVLDRTCLDWDAQPTSGLRPPEKTRFKIIQATNVALIYSSIWFFISGREEFGTGRIFRTTPFSLPLHGEQYGTSLVPDVFKHAMVILLSKYERFTVPQSN